MAYWGFRTPANFAMWLVVTVLLVTGAVWLIIGGVNTHGCNFCYSEFNKDLTVKDPSGTEKGCTVLAFSFALYEPQRLREADPRGNMWGWTSLASINVFKYASAIGAKRSGPPCAIYGITPGEPRNPIGFHYDRDQGTLGCVGDTQLVGHAAAI
ncbi:hypothetical protein VOLCADRAFT_104127 [Volvox carteri f. nagariensis]|uniref:Uncharacterized protein n=1 Tax=Volvox carteri f. nagariensis TaxID=3068 RepID=D8TRE2_VOLCA|nr:uncharacterized protein VOLCADRAFT_104127 [Volvox carteri f. nagariensis]EFJ49880.1 hypothetical protein VOLCADRAFT_104127 [Volvox carteri f. nagariensis]|eukprot:XP_002948945.1 hypothetical protein VOLCADRAFT_104127 [Volvox carteri f. nagariensis]